MNKIVYIIVMIGLFSCKSNSIAQEKGDVKIEKSTEKKSKNNKPQIERPGFGDPRDNEITNINLEDYNRQEPGTVMLNGVLTKFYTNKKICGKSFEIAISIKVDNILKSGPGIVSPFSKDQEITLGFLKSYSKNIESIQKKLEANKKISLTVKENLCPDLGKDTVYEILNFQLLN